MNNTFKVVFLGKFFSGKTSIVNRHFHKTFNINTHSTIGAAYFSLNIGEYRINTWDTSGCDRYGALMPMYYKDASVAIIVYDVTSIDSFKSLIKIIDDIYIHNEEVTIILVGNKIDLERKVNQKDAEKFAKDNNLFYLECSAATNENIETLFDLIFEQIKLKNPIVKNTIKLEDKKLSQCCF